MYWSERQKQLYKAMEKDEEKLKKKLSSFYDKEYAKLDKTIAAFYEKFGTDNVIEYRNLMQSLPEADKMLLIEQSDEFAKKYPQYAHLLPVRNNIYKLNRLEGLQYSVRLNQLNIGAVNNEEITKYLEKQAERGVNAAAEAMGFGKNFNALNGNIASKFVGTNWSNGKNFSERIWENANKLSEYLNNDIATGFARGVNYRKLTDIIQKRYSKVTRNDAYRLIYTEGTYVMAESSMAPFEEDFEQYRVSTVGDSRVCPICRDLSGQVFNIKDRQPGVNFPPLHPWCRCTFTIEVEDWDVWMDEYERKHGGNGAKVSNLLRDDLDKKSDNKTVNTKDDNARTVDDFKKVVGKYKKELDDIIPRESKWSDVIKIEKLPDNTAGEIDWSGNIKLKPDADNTTAIHELLHTYSALHADKNFFLNKGLKGIEETTVAYFAENYMKDKGKPYHKSYAGRTEILYNINNKLNLYDTDFEFAKALISVPVEERYDWLHDKVIQAMTDKGASINDLNEVSKYLKNINEEFE